MGDACSAQGDCCDKNCLGGCHEFDTKNCTVCSKFSMGNGHARKCLDQCPLNTFSVSKLNITLLLYSLTNYCVLINSMPIVVVSQKMNAII